MSDQPGTIPLSEARTKALVEAFAEVVREHYRNSDRGKARVLEVLNALAVNAAFVVASTAPDGVQDCLGFFSEAMGNQLSAVLAAVAERDTGEADTIPPHSRPH